jgi:hypothetical protein
MVADIEYERRSHVVSLDVFMLFAVCTRVKTLFRFQRPKAYQKEKYNLTRQ